MISARHLRLSVATLALAVIAAAAAFHVARASTPVPLLPRLVADPPDGAVLATSSVEGRTRLLLRFNGYLHNDGEGALDVRGSREAPTVAGESSLELQDKIDVYKSREETLPPQIEEELAKPKMALSQRLFTTNEGSPLSGYEYLERPHIEEASSAEAVYANADGHHHWHLQHIANYSLWNAAKDAEVAPSQKVGFCLQDSEHVEPAKGPETPVYAAHGSVSTGFCRQYEPNATSIFGGISPGWRDVYTSGLAFQWVDVSDVTPGEYWLREDADPGELVREAPGGNRTSYATTETTVPGFDAEGQALATGEAEPVTLTLPVRAYGDSERPLESIVKPPAHGTLGPITSGGTVTYTPQRDYAGTDSFSFTARDPNSQFPESPRVGTISVTVASHQPTLAIEGAKESLLAGTSLELSTTVANDSGGVEWEASTGAVKPVGTLGSDAVYTAPTLVSAGSTATLTARLHDDPAVKDEISVKLIAPPASEPLPEVPAVPPVVESHPTARPAPSHPNLTPVSVAPLKPAAHLSTPRAMLLGSRLFISAVPQQAGRIRLSVYLGTRRLGTCAAVTPGRRTFTCAIRLKSRAFWSVPLRIVASLRDGAYVWSATRPPKQVPEMKMRPIGTSGAASAARVGGYWCAPSTLAPTLLLR